MVKKQTVPQNNDAGNWRGRSFSGNDMQMSSESSTSSKTNKPLSETGANIENEDEWEMLGYEGNVVPSTKGIPSLGTSDAAKESVVSLQSNLLSQELKYGSISLNKTGSEVSEELDEKTLQYSFDEDVTNESPSEKKSVCEMGVPESVLVSSDTFRMKIPVTPNPNSSLNPTSLTESELSEDTSVKDFSKIKDSDGLCVMEETCVIVDGDDQEDRKVNSIVHFSLSESDLMQLSEDKKKKASQKLYKSYHSMKLKKSKDNAKAVIRNKSSDKHEINEGNCSLMNLFGKLKEFVCENRVAFYSVAVCSATFFGVLMLFCREWRKNQRLMAHLTKRDDVLLYGARRIPVHRSNSF